MMAMPRLSRRLWTSLACTLLVLTVALPARAAQMRAAYPPLRIQTTTGATYTHNFNYCSPNLYANEGGGAFGAVYETLYIIDYEKYHEYPMLATKYGWSKDLRTLTFTIRQGVKWSDGQPFSAKDVYFTFWTLPKTTKNSSCDPLQVLSKTSLVDGVTMPTATSIAIHFKAADSSRLFSLVNSSWIVPEHQYAQHFKDMATWADADPVGTGPFAKLLSFTPSVIDLGKNPYYWQPGKPAFDVVQLQAYTSQDSANLALEAGQADWASSGGEAIPNVSQLYDARNPNFHHFYGGSLCDNALALLDTKYPYSLVPFRKALSMAINRQALDNNADFSSAPPANSTGTDPWPTWTDKSISQDLVQYNPAASKKMLLAAGFSYKDGKLYDPHGTKVSINLIPTFYPAEGSILAQNFKDIGIDTYVQSLQYGTFYDKMLKGQFDAADEWCNGGPSPYYWYQPMFDVLNYAPVGSNTLNWNFERWHDPVMDKLFASYRSTADKAQQQKIVNQMQQIFYRDMPVIPTVREIVIEEYNTTNYAGFPDASDNYAYSEQFGYGTDAELVLLRLHKTH